MMRTGLLLLLVAMTFDLSGCRKADIFGEEETHDEPTYGSLKVDGTLYTLEESYAFCFRVHDTFLCSCAVKGSYPDPHVLVVLPDSVQTGSHYTTSNIDNLYVSWTQSDGEYMTTDNSNGGVLDLTVDAWPTQSGGEVLMRFSGTLKSLGLDGYSTHNMTEGVLHSYWDSAYDIKAAQTPQIIAGNAVAEKQLIVQRNLLLFKADAQNKIVPLLP